MEKIRYTGFRCANGKPELEISLGGSSERHLFSPQPTMTDRRMRERFGLSNVQHIGQIVLMGATRLHILDTRSTLDYPDMVVVGDRFHAGFTEDSRAHLLVPVEEELVIGRNQDMPPRLYESLPQETPERAIKVNNWLTSDNLYAVQNLQPDNDVLVHFTQ